MEIAIKGASPHDYNATVARCREELAKEGFGIMSEIDVAAKMQEKLGRTMQPYIILGACAPPLAWDAIHAVKDIGVLLPCNVCIYEDDGVTVSAMQPKAALSLIDHDVIAQVAQDVSARLERAIAAVCHD